MKKFVASVYRIAKVVMVISLVGFVGSLIVFNLTDQGGSLGCYAEFFVPFWYTSLMATIPLAWAVGRLKITLEFKEELEQKGGH